MPTDLLSLALYVGLLLPGFAFSIARSRHRPAETRTAFREATAALFVSVICDSVLLAALLLFSERVPTLASETYRAVRNPAREFAQYPYATIYGAMIFLLVASMLGFILGTKTVRKLLRLVTFVRGPETAGSSWHGIFTAVADARVVVGIELTNGAFIQGSLYTFDASATDSPDRGITLSGPLRYRAAGEDELVEVDSGSVVITDRNIRYLTAAYDVDRKRHRLRRRIRLIRLLVRNSARRRARRR